MEFIYETHCHTSESSRCSRSDGASFARYYKALGYDGIFITDHFWGCNIVNMPDDWTWKQKVDRFCLGYENAKAEGDRIGLNVMFAWEAGTDRTLTHLLTYGLDKYWLYENPDVVGLSLTDYADKVHADGGFIVHAHPFREDRQEMTFIPNHIDAVEVINGARANNYRADCYADMLGLPKTAGSDIHLVTTDKNLAGVISDTRILNPSDYIENLKTGRLKLFEKPNDPKMAE